MATITASSINANPPSNHIAEHAASAGAPDAAATPPTAATAAVVVILPPIHREVLLRRGKQPPEPRDLDPTTALQQVFTTDRLEEVLDLPLGDVVQLPPAGLNVSRLVLCAKFAADGEAGCPNRRCRRVHAVIVAKPTTTTTTTTMAVGVEATAPAVAAPPAAAVTITTTTATAAATAAAAASAPRHRVHVNYAWRVVDAVTYPRYDAGMALAIAPPNADHPMDFLDSSMVLKTRALESTRRPLTHCAHYFFNRTCNIGPECRFIHAVYIDTNAKKHQRAPAPAIVHTSRTMVTTTAAASPPLPLPAVRTNMLSTIPTKSTTSITAASSYDNDWLSCPTVERNNFTGGRLGVASHPASSLEGTPALAAATPASGAATPPELSLSVMEGSSGMSPPLSSMMQHQRYRHDAYSWTHVRRAVGSSSSTTSTPHYRHADGASALSLVCRRFYASSMSSSGSKEEEDAFAE